MIQTLTARIDRAEKPHYTIPPTDGGNGDPGPSNPGQQNPWIPPDGINPDKESASTPRQNKGEEVDRGGNNQPPPPPGNTGGDPDPDDDDDDDNEKMEEMAGAGKADVRNATLEDNPFQEMLLPV